MVCNDRFQRTNRRQGWKNEIAANIPIEFALIQLKGGLQQHAELIYSNDPDRRVYYSKNSAMEQKQNPTQNTEQQRQNS